MPQAQRVKVKRAGEFRRVDEIRRHRIFPEQLAEGAHELVLTFRASMAAELEHARCLDGAAAVWSMWAGCLADGSSDRLKAWLATHGIRLEIVHASGHATVTDLQRLAKSVRAGRVVPIHTRAPELYAEFFDNVQRYDDPRVVGGLMASADTPEEETPQRIEGIYKRLRDAGGLVAQEKLGIESADLAQAFAVTVHGLEDVAGSGRFYDDRDRSLRDLAERAAPAGKESPYDTEQLQVLLGLPRWRVMGAPQLDFHYVDREIVMSRTETTDRKATYATDRVRLDALLVNANRGDRTPIVAEIKIGHDENARLALVQALAAAAQLSPEWQRRRLTETYREHFGATVSNRLDIYIIMHDAPTRGMPPKLFEMAVPLAEGLKVHGNVGQWVRRIAFLKTLPGAGYPNFEPAAEIVELAALPADA